MGAYSGRAAIHWLRGRTGPVILLSWSALMLFTAFPFLVALGRQASPASQNPLPAETAKADPNIEAMVQQNQAIQDGINAFREENFKSAGQLFEAAAAIQGTAARNSHAYAWLARTYLHLHRISEAEQAATKATDADKESANAQAALAEVYFRQGKLAQAEEIALGQLKKQNTTPRTYLVLANVHRATANYKSARALVGIAYKSDPKDPDISESWSRSLTREEQLEESKKRLTGGKYEDDERQGLVAAIAVMEDRKKNENRTCRLVNSVSATEMKLEPTMLDPRRFSKYRVDVRVNNAKASLELDTGAGGILVNTKVAERAGLVKIADTALAGIGDQGAAQGYVAFAEKLQIGELEFQNCYLEVVDKKRSVGVDGLIGADVFASYLVEIDSPNQKLKLSQLPPYPDRPGERPSLQSEPQAGEILYDRWIPPEFKEFEKVYRFGHLLLLPVQLNKGPRRLFLLDTGAWDNTLTPAAAKEVSKIHKNEDVKIRGLDGAVNTVYSTGEIALTFGKLRQTRSDLVAFDMTNVSNHVGTEISGVLGFAMLYMLDIKIDYRDNLVDFQYDPNRYH